MTGLNWLVLHREISRRGSPCETRCCSFILILPYCYEWIKSSIKVMLCLCVFMKSILFQNCEVSLDAETTRWKAKVLNESSLSQLCCQCSQQISTEFTDSFMTSVSWANPWKCSLLVDESEHVLYCAFFKYSPNLKPLSDLNWYGCKADLHLPCRHDLFNRSITRA